MISNKINLEKLSNFLPIFLLSSIIAFPRSFSEIKLILILLVLFHMLIRIDLARTNIPQTVVIFYAVQVTIGGIAAFVALINGNEIQAIVEGLRLKVIFSFLIALLLIYISTFSVNVILHNSVLISGFLISLINIIYVVSSYFELDIVSTALRDELLLRVGFHDGYVQLTSHGIGMLFFIIPYLLTFALIKKQNNKSNHSVYIVLILTLVCAAISGRRALWLAVIMTPVFFLIGLILVNSWSLIRLKAVGAMLIIVSCAFLITALNVDLTYTLRHILLAFSADDPRSVQEEYLIKGILDNFWFGSGFGGELGIIRSYDAPWLFELSYHQMLFNYGIFLFAAYVVSLAFIFYRAIKVIKHSVNGVDRYLFAVTIGVSMLFVGSYSNPYLGSFDFLFVVGLFVLMAGKKSPESSGCQDGCRLSHAALR